MVEKRVASLVMHDDIEWKDDMSSTTTHIGTWVYCALVSVEEIGPAQYILHRYSKEQEPDE
jgi:hypothetical protein